VAAAVALLNTLLPEAFSQRDSFGALELRELYFIIKQGKQWQGYSKQ